MKHLTISLFLCFFIGCVAADTSSSNGGSSISSFQECVDAGNPVLRSFPAKCRTADGQIFVDESQKSGSDKSICQDKCGDDKCQMIVCQGQNCPCAETPNNCAKDCKHN